MKSLSPIYSKESIEFATVAKEFISFLETAKELSKKQFISTSIKILPLLYLKGTLLTNIEEFDDEYTEKFIDESAWSYIQQISSSKLDDDDEYIQIQDASIVNSDDYLNVGLSELYADLYQETGDLIGAYKTENDQIIISALHYCRHNFETYWGIRVLSLLKRLHEIYFNTEKE
ncbi:MAG: DUF5063 domain-containing protein [Bacteroidales bacterium]|nr:DUF5063 domain-containing protein [Bacteroidales bacterium]MDD3859506.1 DUF5063 domain-containing protein [Bacteroidales bacterium]